MPAGEGVKSRWIRWVEERESTGLALLESQVSYLGNWVDGGDAVHGDGEIYLYEFSSLK